MYDRRASCTTVLARRQQLPTHPSLAAVVKPPVYGYLRVTDDHDDDQVRQMERGLHKLADAEGFCLASTFYDYDDQPGCHSAFIELVEQLKRGRARHVVVPSLDHFSDHPLLRENRILRLETVGARVWVVGQ